MEKGEEAFVNSTYQNEIEARFAVKCYRFLMKGLKSFDKTKLGIITPYSGQASLLKDLIKSEENTLFCEVEVNSVDSFQGREKDIVIFSTVRSSYEGIEEELVQSIGFLRDKRRMNVGLSRARVGLIIIGDMNRLTKAKQGEKWKFLIDYCKQKNRCFRVDVKDMDSYMTSFQKNPNNYLIKSKEKKEKKPKKVKDNANENGEVIEIRMRIKILQRLKLKKLEKVKLKEFC